MNRTGWTATLGGVGANNIFDGNNTTYSTASSLPLILDVDMQSVKENITGIRIQNQSRNYCMTSARVYIRESESGDYQLQGTVTVARPANSSPYVQFIRFVGPVKARYIRLEMLSFYSNNFPIRLSEFIPYQGV